VNLEPELAAAAAWAHDNPKNRKSNWGRFLTAWLKRAQDRAPARGGKPAPVIVTCDFRGEPYDPSREPCAMGNAVKGAFYGCRPLCPHHEREVADRAAPRSEMPDGVRTALSDLVKKKVSA
jgi:hypothetical protein